MILRIARETEHSVPRLRGGSEACGMWSGLVFSGGGGIIDGMLLLHLPYKT